MQKSELLPIAEGKKDRLHAAYDHTASDDHNGHCLAMQPSDFRSPIWSAGYVWKFILSSDHNNLKE